MPCSLCGSPDSQLPHVNCANVDCNELFIACAACKARFSGCCCEACMAAPRLLRPAKVEGGHYGMCCSAVWMWCGAVVACVWPTMAVRHRQHGLRAPRGVCGGRLAGQPLPHVQLAPAVLPAL